MIKFDITLPQKPKKEDFVVSDVSIERAEAINEHNRKQHQSYISKNQSTSMWLGFIGCCVIAAIVIHNVNPKVTGLGLIFCAIVFGGIAMIPFGFIFSNLFESVGKEIEPSRKPRDDSYQRADRYLDAKKRYEDAINLVRMRYADSDEVDYDIIKYNELCVNRLRTKVDEMLKFVRVRSMRCSSLHLSRIFKNLDIIGAEIIELINPYHHVYKCARNNEIVAISFMNVPNEHYFNVFCQIIDEHNIPSAIVIVDNPNNLDDSVRNIIDKRKIEIIGINQFERGALKVIESTELPDNIKQECEDIPFPNNFKLSARYEGNGTRIFKMRVVNEVFSSKKEILEKIKSSPKIRGMYGIISINGNITNGIYGVVYFEWEDEFDYYREWFTDAIHAYRQEISKIIPSNAGTWDPHKRFTYQYWSSYLWD